MAGHCHVVVRWRTSQHLYLCPADDTLCDSDGSRQLLEASNVCCQAVCESPATLTFLGTQYAQHTVCTVDSPPPVRVSKSCRAVQATDKELVMVQKHWHVLIKEPGNEQIVARIIDWVHKRS